MKEDKVLLIVLSIFIPPLAVWLVSEGSNKRNIRTVIACALTLFTYVLGLLYALDIVLDKKVVYEKIDELMSK